MTPSILLTPGISTRIRPLCRSAASPQINHPIVLTQKLLQICRIRLRISGIIHTCAKCYTITYAYHSGADSTYSIYAHYNHCRRYNGRVSNSSSHSLPQCFAYIMSYIDCSPIRLIWKYPTPRDIIVKHFLEKYFIL